MTARAVAQILFRHQLKMLACLVAALALGAAAAAVHEPRYRAEATLLAGGGDSHALAALFESRDLHARVLGDFGERLYPALAADLWGGAFASDLKVRPVSGAPLVRLALDGHDPQNAAQALAALMEAVRDRNDQVFAVASEEGEDAAEQARAELAALRKRLGVFDLASERENLLARRAQIQAQAEGAEAEAKSLGDALTLLRARLAATPRTIELTSENERSRVVEEARAKLFELQTEEQQLLGKYQESSVFVQRVRAEAKNARQLLDRLMNTSDTKVTTGANQVHQHLETELMRTEAQWTSAQSRSGTLARQVADIDDRLVALAENAKRIAALERQSGEAGDPAAAGGSAVAGIGIIQSAGARTQAVGPGPFGILALAALAGLVLAVIVAALAQRLSESFTTPAELESRLGLKVLTSIPRES